eukprot:Skav223005  [mRNA]  locus=scaffold1827:617342:618640:- [translate_table: standard]
MTWGRPTKEANPGYELDPDFFVEEAEAQAEELRIGSPCLHVSSQQHAAYLGPARDEIHRICLLGKGQTLKVPRREIVPLPTEFGGQGDYVLYVDPHPSLFHLVGRLALCGSPIKAGDPLHSQVPDKHYMMNQVTFPDPMDPQNGTPFITALPTVKLVRLPMHHNEDIGPWELYLSKTPLPMKLPRKMQKRRLEEAQEASDEDNASIDMASEDELGKGPVAVFSQRDLKKFSTDSLGVDVTKFFKNKNEALVAYLTLLREKRLMHKLTRFAKRFGRRNVLLRRTKREKARLRAKKAAEAKRKKELKLAVELAEKEAEEARESKMRAARNTISIVRLADQHYRQDQRRWQEEMSRAQEEMSSSASEPSPSEEEREADGEADGEADRSQAKEAKAKAKSLEQRRLEFQKARAKVVKHGLKIQLARRAEANTARPP